MKNVININEFKRIFTEPPEKEKEYLKIILSNHKKLEQLFIPSFIVDLMNGE